MATRRGSPKSRGPKKGARSNGQPAGKRSGNVTIGPVVKRATRVPIDPKIYARKESEIAQLGVKNKHLRTKIKPDQVQIAENLKTIRQLTEDIDTETEEREIEVRDEFHWNTKEVRTISVETGKEVDRRTMTASDMKRQEDFEDAGTSGKGRVGQAPRAEEPEDAGDAPDQDEDDDEPSGEPVVQ